MLFRSRGDKGMGLPGVGAETVIEEIDIPFLPGRAPGGSDDNKEAAALFQAAASLNYWEW